MANQSNQPNYPTPYVASVRKVMQNGEVTIEGHPAPTVEQAIANLQSTRDQYYESGGWGGPGAIALFFTLQPFLFASGLPLA